MGQVANQMLIEMIARLRDKYREKRAAQKEKARKKNNKNN